MKNLNATKRITLATLKSFARKNQENLFVKEVSSFSGMSDMVEFNESPSFKKTEFDVNKTTYFKTGIQGVYTTRSGNLFDYYEDSKFVGIEIYNCCGSSIVATLK